MNIETWNIFSFSVKRRAIAAAAVLSVPRVMDVMADSGNSGGGRDGVDPTLGLTHGEVKALLRRRRDLEQTQVERLL